MSLKRYITSKKKYTPTTKTLTGYDTTTMFDSYDYVEYGFEINNPNSFSVLMAIGDELSGASLRNITIPANSVITVMSDGYTLDESDILAGELSANVIFTEFDDNGKILSREQKTFNIPINIAEPRGELTVTITEKSSGPYTPGNSIECLVRISNTGNLTLCHIITEIEPSGEYYHETHNLPPFQYFIYESYYDIREADVGTSIVFDVTARADSPDTDNPDIVANSSLTIPVVNSLTIHYVYEDETTVFDDYVDYLASGETYSVPIQEKQYYDTYVNGTQMNRITGTMGNSNIEITVTYVRRTASHTICHLDLTGGIVLPSVTLTGPQGDTETYTVPELDGYTSIPTSGTIITITYNNRNTTILYTPELIIEEL